MKKYAKKILISALSLLCFSCFAQSAAEKAQNEKLENALKLLPARTRSEITIKADSPSVLKTEFFSDLKKVLAADTDDLLRLVDKTHPLVPESYKAPDIVSLTQNEFYSIGRNDLSLRVPVEAALRTMGAAAKKDGITLLASSSYRSYEYQVQVYTRIVREIGKEAADRESAMPGKSQHQLGAVVDFGSITDEYAQTRAGRWLLANAPKYGWSISFPDGYEDATGYRWECWHYRYVGIEACKFQKKYFNDIQQFMLEFIDAWKKLN
ncbi:MAG: M15 family metallopeptidase [Treponemataceae bacterium]|nr:MAG: M15 family metallopeptidase [Treponemataceae bacterium]